MAHVGGELICALVQHYGASQTMPIARSGKSSHLAAIKQPYVVTAHAHHPMGRRYLGRLAAYFGRRFPQAHVSLRLGHDPDEDVVYMAHARTFIPSGGQYSRVIAALVDIFGGRVINTHGCIRQAGA